MRTRKSNDFLQKNDAYAQKLSGVLWRKEHLHDAWPLLSQVMRGVQRRTTAVGLGVADSLEVLVTSRTPKNRTKVQVLGFRV